MAAKSALQKVTRKKMFYESYLEATSSMGVEATYGSHCPEHPEVICAMSSNATN
jgi:hypothetical protein